MTPARRALNEYKQTNIDAGAAYADPHTLITMLFDGVQERISIAKGAMERKDFATKGKAISKAMDIIAYLQSCLDKEKGGDLASNLDSLYDYMIRRLLDASSANKPELLDEVSSLLQEVGSAWSAIRVAANKQVEGEAAASVGEV
ncbi:flagellar export chaperone FliS [Methyloterricola oryzae]|uniref:flagellar export chaperone FliS n=1 Tax=Methyloterricola oryzae TaxID=1495050 RepID=UPI0005EB6D23|nr:flagellar export chaperone FliS [Methyloterricola oryzae]